MNTNEEHCTQQGIAFVASDFDIHISTGSIDPAVRSTRHGSSVLKSIGMAKRQRRFYSAALWSHNVGHHTPYYQIFMLLDHPPMNYTLGKNTDGFFPSVFCPLSEKLNFSRGNSGPGAKTAELSN